MKIEPKAVRFHSMLRRPGLQRFHFASKKTALQIQETGLVVQGPLQDLSMPLFDHFFRLVLSEHSTVTIPYARIRSLSTEGLVGLRIGLTFLVWLPFLFPMLLLLNLNPPMAETLAVLFEPGGEGSFFLMLGLQGVVLSLYINWALSARERLVFEQGNGKLGVISFCIRNEKRRQAFLEKVKVYRRQAQNRLVAEVSPPN